MKKYHYQRIEKREFVIGDLLLLFNSRLHLLLGMLKSKFIGPFLVTKCFPHRVVDVENNEGTRFKVNGQRINIYLGNTESVQIVVEAYYLD